MGGFERATLRWSRVAVIISSLVAGIVGLQWYEMHTTGIDTHDLAIAAGKQADRTKDLVDRMRDQADRTKDLADRMAESLKKTDKLIEQATAQTGATNALAEQAHRSAESAGQSVVDNRIFSYRELRPYVQVTRFDIAGDVFKGEMVKGKASIINSGRTPAVNVNGCGDIVMKPNSDPMTDEFPCPAPNNPKSGNEGERSRFALGSNAAGFTVDSPGTSMTLTNAPVEFFRRALSSGALRIYFYGYVDYSDITDINVIHHTTFCGRYNIVTGMFDICEKHNRMD